MLPVVGFRGRRRLTQVSLPELPDPAETRTLPAADTLIEDRFSIRRPHLAGAQPQEH